MSMNKYISGIINCLDTVPSLKKQLVRAFKKVEEDVAAVTIPVESAVLSIPETLTLETGTNALGNHLIKVGDIVYIHLGLEGSINAWSNIGSIPEGYRPKYPVKIVNVENAKKIQISTSGIIQSSVNISSGVIDIVTSWIAE